MTVEAQEETWGHRWERLVEVILLVEERNEIEPFSGLDPNEVRARLLKQHQ